MTLISTKQINAFVGAPVKASSFSANGASNSVTTIIATTLATASASGGAVTVTNASAYNTQGIVVGTTLKVRIQNSTTKKALVTSTGYEIFGELTYSNPTYTLTYYYINAGGVKTATSISGPITIDFIFYYQFKLIDLPVTALTDASEFYYNGHPITLGDLTGTAGAYFVTTNASTLKAETIYAFDGYAIPFSSVNYVATNVGDALDEAILTGFPAVLSQDAVLANGYVFKSQNGTGTVNTRYGGVNSQAFIGANSTGTTGWSFYTAALAKVGFGTLGATPTEIIFDVAGTTLNSLRTILGFNQEIYLVNNTGAPVTTSDVDRRAVAIGARNLVLDTAVVNTVAVGGDYQGYTAAVSNTLYTPNKMYMVNLAGTFATQVLSAATSNITLSLPVITSSILGVVSPTANYFPVYSSTGTAIVTSSLISQNSTTQEVGINATPVVGTLLTVESFNSAGTKYAAFFEAAGNLATNNYALKLNAANGISANYALLIANGNFYQQTGSAYFSLTPDSTVKVGISLTTELIGLKTISTSGGLALQTGLHSDLSGVNTVNRALYLSATNATTNYALIVAAGQSVFGATTATTASALVEFTSTTKGLVLPRLTTVQMNAIATPVAGMIIYNTTQTEFYYYNGATWQSVDSSAALVNPVQQDITLDTGYKFTAETFQVEDTASAFHATVITDTLAANRSIKFPDANGTLMVGTGTANKLAKFGAAQSIANSSITDTGTSVTFSTVVGIGTTTPPVNLFAVAADNATAAIAVARYQSSATSAAGYVGVKARGTQASPTAILAGDAIADYTAIGYSGAAFNALSGKLRFGAAENFTAIASGTDFSIELAPIGATAVVEVLRVTSEGRVGIGTDTPDSSAILDLTSTTGALLVPRMSTIERGLLTPTNGMIVYDVDVDAFYFYESGAWVTGSGLA